MNEIAHVRRRPEGLEIKITRKMRAIAGDLTLVKL